VRVAVLESAQQQVFLQRVGLSLELLVDSRGLLLLADALERQKAFDTEALPFRGRKSGALVQQWITKHVCAAQTDADRAAEFFVVDGQSPRRPRRV
jgi:hypothetical protein